MARRREWDDDDDDRPLRRKKSGPSTGLIVGLSLGGAALVAVIVAVVVLAVGKRNRGGDEAAAPSQPPVGTFPQFRKPKGERTSGNFQSVDDPAVVDKVWSKLAGKWEPIDPSFAVVYEFRSDYVYISTSTDRQTPEVWTNPVVLIRDDTGTSGTKKGDQRYSLFYKETRADGAERDGSTIVDVHPDGTLTINMWRYRKAR